MGRCARSGERRHPAAALAAAALTATALTATQSTTHPTGLTATRTATTLTTSQPAVWPRRAVLQHA